MRVTLEAVNEAIRSAGYSAELVRAGSGYFYFTGASVAMSRDTI